MKEIDKNSIDDLLIRVITGIASENDFLEFDKWLQSDEKNRDYYQKFLIVLNIKPNLEVFQEIDVESSLKNVKKRIVVKPDGKLRFLALGNFIRVAAVLVLAFGFYLVYHSVQDANEVVIKMVKTESLDERKSVVLPDNSVVSLNIGSNIEFPEKFDGNERRVKFSGEAYFEVTPDKEKPFIIETDQSEIKVVGTAFNLKALNNSKTESIVVTEGKVLFSGKTVDTKAPLFLEKGEIGLLDSEKNSLSKAKTRDLNFLSWKTGVFEFKDALFSEALQMFSEYYRCKFEIIDKQIGSNSISGKYNNLKLEELISVLELTMNIKIEKSGDKYLILKIQ